MLFYMLVLGLVTMVSGETCCVPDAMEGVAGMVVSTTVEGMPSLVKEIQYSIMNGSCTKFVLKEMMPQCIPENATLVEETFLGAGSEKVAVKTYKFIIANIEIYFTVTASGCVPILMEASLPLGVGMEVMNFSGITMDVKDPPIFDIPPICQSSNISTRHVAILSRLGRYVFH